MSAWSYEEWLIDQVKMRLDYNEDTGIFVWKSGRNAGRRAGCYKNPNGYTTIQVRVGLRSHNFTGNRLAWCLVYGRFPREGFVIDHKDGIKSNDRIKNLQEVTQAVNLELARVRARETI